LSASSRFTVNVSRLAYYGADSLRRSEAPLIIQILAVMLSSILSYSQRPGKITYSTSHNAIKKDISDEITAEQDFLLTAVALLHILATSTKIPYMRAERTGVTRL